MTPVRLILERVPTPGAWNMAVDETLLESALANGIATVRLYEWSAPTVSLGYFQDASEFERDPQWHGLAAVRRLSGGGAILHDREITYSIALPPSHPLTAHPSRLYAIVHRAFINVLANHGIAARVRGDLGNGVASGSPLNDRIDAGSSGACSPLTAHHSPHTASLTPAPSPLAPLSINHQPSTINPAPIDHRPSTIDPFLCFGRGDPNDIVLGAHKIVGSAQRRRRGAILQHGSVLLERSPHAPDFPGLADLTGVRLDSPALSQQVATAIAVALDARPEPAELTATEHDAARSLEYTRYRILRWRGRSPSMTIDQ